MIPTNLNSDTDLTDLAVGEEPGLTYKIVDGEKVIGQIDELEAVKQAIAVILNVERYKYPIYTWDYGVELEDLIGRDVAYVCPEMARRIQEALVQDERILSVDGWSFDKKGSTISASFTVHTIYGEVDTTKEVTI